MTASPFARPFALGEVGVPNRLVLAPMAGITTSAYRRRLKAYGIGLCCSEMVSVHGIVHGDRRTLEYLAFRREERPLAVQLFGEDPETVARAAEIVLQREPRPDIIDLNMGCPVRKVAKTGAGCALMARPEQAAAIARAAVGVARPRGVPVTAKIRSGPDEARISAVELSVALEEAGVSGIAVHPRTAAQHYRGRADHRVTAAVVAAVGVPVMASGDVASVEAAARILAETGAAAVMVGRGAVGNPWLVRDLLAGEDGPRPGLDVVVDELRALLDAAAADMGSRRAGLWARKLLRPYLRPSGVAGEALAALARLPDAAALDEALRQLATPGFDPI